MRSSRSNSSEGEGEGDHGRWSKDSDRWPRRHGQRDGKPTGRSSSSQSKREVADGDLEARSVPSSEAAWDWSTQSCAWSHE